ncbi:hypothetical protein H4683_000289 [Filibacter limicola]|uniref:Uncharacterized protein n=1 Tax=Sporosarcina limicola TaxID=34101 RepID=A0A927MER7_9BACL|nr:hypothetical protein [Sporosarcina limicola]
MKSQYENSDTEAMTIAEQGLVTFLEGIPRRTTM